MRELLASLRWRRGARREEGEDGEEEGVIQH